MRRWSCSPFPLPRPSSRPRARQPSASQSPTIAILCKGIVYTACQLLRSPRASPCRIKPFARSFLSRGSPWFSEVRLPASNVVRAGADHFTLHEQTTSHFHESTPYQAQRRRTPCSDSLATPYLRRVRMQTFHREALGRLGPGQGWANPCRQQPWPPL